MSLCTSIDTLAMAYLDDELAGEERRELELHLHDCTDCRKHVDGEREELGMLRGKLAAPPAPDLLRARITRALDGEDAQVVRAQRRRWSTWLLPGSAMIAAASALLLFVTVRPPGPQEVGAVAQEAVRQHTRSMPLEVQGASTGPWLHEHFTPSVEVPQFTAPGIKLVGARLTAVNGHDGALLAYSVALGDTRIGLSALVIRDARAEDLAGGDEIQVGNRVLHAMESNGLTAVTFIDIDHMGYAFMSDRLSTNELVQLVVQTDLIGRVQRGR
jgi:anti-sigma factor RsiW